MIPRVTGENITDSFLHDWVRVPGKPCRSLTDGGGTGYLSKAREDASDVYGWQLVASPVRTQSHNGLAEWSVRSIKTAIRYILATGEYP